MWNGGQVAAVDSPEQRTAGIADSHELMMLDMLAAGRGFNHTELLRMLVEQSTETAEWTKSVRRPRTHTSLCAALAPTQPIITPRPFTQSP